MDNILTINNIGAFASIISALWAWKQARNAKRYSERSAEQIANQRRISELTELDAKWNETYKLLAVFGAGSRTSEITNENPSDAAMSVQDYLATIMKYKTSLIKIQDINKRYATLTRMLEKFSKASGETQLKDSGSILLKKLIDLSSDIHKILTSLRETVNIT